MWSNGDGSAVTQRSRQSVKEMDRDGSAIVKMHAGEATYSHDMAFD